MILVIDVGNTHTVLGLYQEETLVRQWRLLTDAERTTDEYGVLLNSLFSAADVAAAGIEGVAVSCVVPPMIKVVEALSQELFQCRPLVVGPGTKTGMPILYDVPREVGADRIVNAVAAYERYHDVTIVVDFGTATTFDYVTANGEYLGGGNCAGGRYFAGCPLQQDCKTVPGRVGETPQGDWAQYGPCHPVRNLLWLYGLG